MRRATVVLGALAALAAGGAAVRAATDPTIGFGKPISLAGEARSMIPAIFDATGDGVPDVVLAPYYDTGVRVFPGRGDGTFGEMFAVPTARKWAGSLLHARLNADATDDMVFAELSTIEVLLSDGSGGFASATYPWPSDPPIGAASPALLDWDGDGDLDVFAVGGMDTFGLWLNDGTGHFGAPTVAPIAPVNRSNNVQAVPADLDDDGDVDLAIVENARIRLYWRQPDGSFQAGTPLTTGGAQFVQRFVVASDVDGDRLADIVAYTGQPTILVFRHTSAAAFDAGTVLAAPSGAMTWQIATPDLNGDGRPEIVTPNSVFVNHGDGTFAPARPFPLPNGFAVAAGDLDADGRPDVVTDFVGNSTVTTAAAVLLVGEPGSHPSITRLTPPSLFHGTAAEVQIVGTEFDPKTSIDFGPGIFLSSVRFDSSTSMRVQVAVAADAVTGPHQIRLENPDGAVATGTFTVLGGGIAAVTTLTPDRAHAGETVDITVTGAEFIDAVAASLGAGITVNSTTFVAEDVVLINATLAADADLGVRDLTIANGSGLVTDARGAFIVLPVRSLDVTTTRGRARGSRRAGRGSLVVEGLMRFNAFSPDGRFDPATEGAEIRVGDTQSPVVLAIGPDLGWRIDGTRAEWRSAKGAAGPRARVTLDFGRGTFRIAVSGADVAIPVSGDMQAELTLGGEPGTSVRRWTASRGGLVLK